MKAHFVVAAILTFCTFASAQNAPTQDAPTQEAPTQDARDPNATVVVAQPLDPADNGMPADNGAPVTNPSPPDDPKLSPAQQAQIKDVKLANAAFFRAIELRDKAGLDKSLADEAVLSGAGAGALHVDTKDSFEKAVADLGFPVKSIAVEAVDVKLQSETMVAFGTVDLSIANGLDIVQSQESFMNVFAKRRGKLQLIISYSAPIPKAN